MVLALANEVKQLKQEKVMCDTYDLLPKFDSSYNNGDLIDKDVHVSLSSYESQQNGPSDNEYDDFVDNIEELIHVGKHNWDVIGYDGDPIYDIEGHLQKFPLQLSYEVTNFDNWQQGDGMITNFFQTPKDDLVL